jgi:hypothetical protein
MKLITDEELTFIDNLWESPTHKKYFEYEINRCTV